MFSSLGISINLLAFYMEQRPLSPTHVLRCIYEIDSKLRSGVRWIEAVSL